MKKVLLIENNLTMLMLWEMKLQMAGVTTVSATTLAEAEQKFAQGMSDGGWDVIVLDACIQTESEIDCLSLLATIKKTYKGPIIAASNEVKNRKLQMANGCTHDAVGADDLAKANAPGLAMEILGVTMPELKAA